MDQELRKAEIAGNWQRIYALLNRAGRHEEAKTLFLDHPITVDCTIQYQYRIHWHNHDAENYYERQETLVGYDLNQLIEEFITLKVGTSQISSIYRNPIYRVLGGEICEGAFAGAKPLNTIVLTEKTLQQIKIRIKAHPDYMHGASQEQLEAARWADERDAEKAIRKIQQEERQEIARQRRQAIQDNFEKDSNILREEVWDL